MFKKNAGIRSSASVFIVLGFVALIAILNVFLSFRVIQYSDSLIDTKLDTNVELLNLYLQDSETNTRIAALSTSINPDMVDAIIERDRNALLRLILPELETYRLNYFIVTDSEGYVLVRTHAPEIYGDSVLDQQNILNALAGNISTHYEEGTIVRVALRTGAPVYDADGTLIGAVSAGIRFDSDETVRMLSDLFNADISVFFEDERIHTTIVRNGQSIVGTTLDPRISEIVIDNGQTYIGDSFLLGEEFKTIYIPLINAQDETFAALFLGISMSQLRAETNLTIITAVVVSIAGTMLLFLMLYRNRKEKRQLLEAFEERDSFAVKLQDEHDRVKLLVDTTPFACHLWNKDFQLIDCNLENLRLFDLDSKKDFVDFFHNFSPKYQPSGQLSAEMAQESIQEAFKKGRSYNPEYMHQKLDGTPMPTEITLVLVPYQAEYVVAAYLRDLREHNQMMVEIEARNEIIKTEQIKLEEALEDAEKANSSKSDFLASMSHEMRTPLNAVIGLSELCLEEKDISEDTRMSLERIYSAGDTLLNTVNDILDISKIEAGKMELVPSDYDVPSLINDTITQNVMRIGEKPIELKLDICDKMLARMHGDELRVKQIINNLLSNAIKYTNKGTVSLYISCHSTDVHTADNSENVWFKVIVKDTGVGIRAQDMDKLFLNYEQLNIESNRKTEGTGLGLPLSKKLTEMMNGSIDVQSEYGVGSTFTVKLLQKRITDATIGSEVVSSLKNFHYSDSRRRHHTKITRIHIPYARVLVVDDNMTNLDVARGLMKPYGMRIDCVNNGFKAIDAVKNEDVRYNAIFMDHMMPGIDGIETVQRIREIGTDYAKNIPIIALTANAIAGNEEMFLSKGFQAFLPKPIHISRLDNIIRNWVRDKEQEKQMRDLSGMSGENADIRETPADSYEESRIDREKAAALSTQLDIEKGIERFGGDEDAYLNVLRSFATNTRVLLDSIENVNKESLSEYAITVHGIKGSSRGIFADKVGDFAEDLEKASTAGNFKHVVSRNKAFLDEVRELIHSVEGFLSDIGEHADTGDKAVRAKKEKPDTEVLRQLSEACEIYDMDEVEKSMGELMKYEYMSGSDLIDWLKENVSLMNFSEIVKRLSENS
jgi:signal transduction histidine kinase/DNA-binding response OmpR family regulator/HPt (histidine-containing phosphotransfer) domain-containing protein